MSSLVQLAGVAPLLSGIGAADLELPVTFDLTDLEWATPFDLAALGVLNASAVDQGTNVNVLVPEDDTVRRYLVDAGIDAFLDGAWGPGGGSVTEPPLVRLTRVDAGQEWEDRLATLWPEIRTTIGDYESARRTIEIMSELIDNATTHGRSSLGTFVCAQRYTGATSGFERGIWIGIADGGVGIPNHLRRRKEYAGELSDKELIKLARRPGVTGTADQRGYGFYEVFEEAAAASPSHLLIRAGHGEGDFRLSPGKTLHAAYRETPIAVLGTWIHVRIDAP